MKTHCDRCGMDCREITCGFIEFVPIGKLVEVKPFYQVTGVTHVCHECADKGNKFINYFGRKRKEDLRGLHNFLVNGPVSSKVVDRVYSQLMNGGYYQPCTH